MKNLLLVQFLAFLLGLQLVANNCESLNDLTVTSNMIIVTPEEYNTIYVKSGAVLKIRNTTVNIHKRIVVERRAKLIVEKSLITSCGPDWYGIEVWGNKDMEQYPQMITNDTYLPPVTGPQIMEGPGCVILRDKAQIANARSYGIICQKRNPFDLDSFSSDNYSGGLVYAENSTFRNNQNGVYLTKYLKTNLSSFNRCKFKIKEDFNPNGTDQSGIKIDKTQNIIISDCEFTNEYNLSNKGNLINAVGISNLTGSMEVNGSTITGWDVGIKLNTTPGWPVTLSSIGGSLTNTFHNTKTGIDASNVENVKIVNNIFSGDIGWLSGIMIGSDGNYVVSENTFSNQILAVVASNTGNSNVAVFKNEFNDNFYAVTATGKNEGLYLRCNDFNENYNSIVLTGGNVQNPTSIKSVQGHPKNPAGNKFSSPCISTNSHIFTQGQTEHFTYYYNAVDAEQNPSCTANANFTKFSTFYFPSGCSNLIEGGGGQEEHDPNDIKNRNQVNPVNLNSILNGVNINEVEAFKAGKLKANNTLNLKREMKIKPNPAQNITRVEISGEGYEQLNILDLNGRLIQTIDLQSDQKQVDIDLVNLNNGIYFVNLVGANTKVASSKFIVQK